VIVDPDTFTDLARHLHAASAALFEAARRLAAMESGQAAAARAFAPLLSVGMELVALAATLRALANADRPAEEVSAARRDDGVLPHAVA
jgi:hypothetical protein